VTTCNTNLAVPHPPSFTSLFPFSSRGVDETERHTLLWFPLPSRAFFRRICYTASRASTRSRKSTGFFPPPFFFPFPPLPLPANVQKGRAFCTVPPPPFWESELFSSKRDSSSFLHTFFFFLRAEQRLESFLSSPPL